MRDEWVYTIPWYPEVRGPGLVPYLQKSKMPPKKDKKKAPKLPSKKELESTVARLVAAGEERKQVCERLLFSWGTRVCRRP